MYRSTVKHYFNTIPTLQPTRARMPCSEVRTVNDLFFCQSCVPLSHVHQTIIQVHSQQKIVQLVKKVSQIITKKFHLGVPFELLWFLILENLSKLFISSLLQPINYPAIISTLKLEALKNMYLFFLNNNFVSCTVYCYSFD